VPAVAFEAQAHVIRVPKRQGARVEASAGVELTVPEELHFGAGKLAVVAEFKHELPPVSLQRPQRFGWVFPRRRWR
jgi:hypothetical protein